MAKNSRVVFVLVEGVTEETVFAVLTRLLVNSRVHICFASCDLTSDIHVTPGNVLSKIVELIKGYADPLGLKSKHFQEVIHLVDTDGTFIPATCVIQEE